MPIESFQRLVNLYYASDAALQKDLEVVMAERIKRMAQHGELETLADISKMKLPDKVRDEVRAAIPRGRLILDAGKTEPRKKEGVEQPRRRAVSG